LHREVYKDAFAPPPQRLVKAWERAPVAAHAQRLQGHKIWKKVGVRSQQGKENHDAAQAELEKEGAGARKKLRMIGMKENIGDALWQDELSAEPVTSKGINILEPTKDILRSPLKDSTSDALQFIPRKRTNTNHVITPQKLFRKIPLDDFSQIPVRDSAQNTTKKIPLNDDSSTDQVPGEKPVRRRKSLRKSTRRLTSGEATTQAPSTQVEQHSANTEAAGNAGNSAQPTDMLHGLSKDNTDGPRTMANSQPFEHPQQAPTLQQNALRDLKAQDDNMPMEVGVEEPQQASNMADKVEVPGVEAVEDINAERGPSIQSAPSLTALNVNYPLENDNEREPFEDQSLKLHPTVLPSIEANTRAESVSPGKSSGTPKAKKRGRGQRRGSRRGTRTTRASSTRAATPQACPAEVSQVESSTKLIAASNLNDSKELRAEHFTSASPIKMSTASPQGVPDLVEKESIEIATAEPSSSVSAPSEVDMTASRPGLGSEISINGTGHVEASENLENCQNPPAEIAEFVIEALLESVVSNPEQEIQYAEEDLHTPITSEREVMSEEQIDEERSEIQLADDPATSPFIESSPVKFSPAADAEPLQFHLNPDDQFVEILEVLEPISVSITDGETSSNNELNDSVEELPETSTPDPTTTDLVEAISQNAPPATYDQDDTDMLRNFLTRVKANKAAKAGAGTPKRKRSLPHSPLRLPLGEADPNLSPSAQESKDEFDVSLPSSSPSTSKRRKRKEPTPQEEDMTEPRSIRRSGRARLAVKAPLIAPSFIPIRRLGQDEDTTVTLRRSEEKELAALTRVNTRKNKGGALHVVEVLAKKSEEKDDPAVRQRALKEIFDEKAEKGKKEKKGKSVVWAEELAQYQFADGKKSEVEKEVDSSKEKDVIADEKKGAVRVGVRSKITLGMGVNGTPVAKRRVRARQ
jgi:hypothetical protein